ncbi:hypothetical protein CCP4SC76_5710001 [Gammaproteobacteria bacterium]
MGFIRLIKWFGLSLVLCVAFIPSGYGAATHFLGSIEDTAAPTVLPPTGACPPGMTCKPGVGLPSRVDYREQGIVTPIKDQGACGSCDVFATYGTLEAFLIRNGYGTFDLSEEYTLSCIGFDICVHGSNHTDNYRFLSQTGTIPESFLPYSAPSNPTCLSANNVANQYNFPYKGLTYEKIKITSSVDLKSALVAYGPLTVSFDVYQDFFDYASGVSRANQVVRFSSK